MPLNTRNTVRFSSARIRLVRILLAFGSLTACVGASAANLVSNSDFQTALDGWNATVTGNNATISFDGTSGSPGNGSAFLNATVANSTGTLSQCVAIDAPKDIDLIGRTITNSSLGAGSDLEIRMQSFNQEYCMGTLLETQNASSLEFLSPWVERSLGNHPLPVGTHSVLISAFVTAGSGSMSAHVDHILFGPAGTTGTGLGLQGGGITCVKTMADLQQAVVAAQADRQANYIKVESGTYTLTSSAPILKSSVTDGFPLTIEGGYDATCATPGTGVTTISGGNIAGTSVFLTSGGLTVRDVTFTGMNPAAGSSAITVGDDENTAPVHIENVVVKGNRVTGVNDSIVKIYANGGMTFDDNIIAGNQNAFASLYVYANYPLAPVTFANNTVADNAGPGVDLYDVYSNLAVDLYNNIFWSNGGEDLLLPNENTGLGGVVAIDNTYLNCLNCSNLSLASANNSTANPQLNTTTFAPNSTSPVINAGMPQPLVLPATDAAGAVRVQGSAPDKGALESSTDDITSTEYLVTSANDSGVLTLRQAIIDANLAGKPALIKFHVNILDQTCGPHVIVLNSPLPPIEVPMIVDGYSQPGSVANTVSRSTTGQVGTNATICVQIIGNTGSSRVANAMSVPESAAASVHVEVKGILFGNFNSAIELSGGSGNWIHGNAFASTGVGGLTLGNGTGITIDGGVADVIGGAAPADVNLIGGSASTGLVITGYSEPINQMHTVINNDVGGTDGSAFGNGNSGIALLNTQYQTLVGNWIAANGGDGILIDDSIDNLIQLNTIGRAGHGNQGAGINVTDFSSGNYIGSTTTSDSFGANDIESNGGPGVWIETGAGDLNQIAGNSVQLNGGIAIDLDALGPTANSGNENTGPNDLLHKPFLSSIDYVAGGSSISVLGTLTTQPNRRRYVSVFASSRCGDTAQLLGTVRFDAQPDADIALNFTMPAPSFAPAFITAVAIDGDVTSDTSEQSNCKILSPSDDIFNDGLDDF